MGRMTVGEMDIGEIMRHLPHRYPFLLVDRVLECVPGERIKAIKNVTANEPFFPGTFPRLSGHAWRADHRSAGASLGDPGLQDAQSNARRQVAYLLRGHRRRALPAARCCRATSCCSSRPKSGWSAGSASSRFAQASTVRWLPKQNSWRHCATPECQRCASIRRPSLPATRSLRPASRSGPYSIIGPEVAIGEGTVIGAHVVIAQRTTLGRRNRVFQFASLGEIPQDRKYDGRPTRTVIGDDNVIREYVTIHAGTAQDRGVTTIGNGNWLLAYSHIAHDCVVGNATTFSNNAQLAGHVVIDDHAVLGGFVGVHQFCRVGAHAFIAAGSIVLQDVPPYVTVGRVSGEAARDQQRGSAAPGLHDGRPRRDQARLQDAVPLVARTSTTHEQQIVAEAKNRSRTCAARRVPGDGRSRNRSLSTMHERRRAAPSRELRPASWRSCPREARSFRRRPCSRTRS